ncbi:MAG: NADH-quinone oxidoreductase subunit NuoH [Deltaproteobacteria bacterium]|nr:NADH-quinone oxidoreductase subunit NuoH [Deltaproteobacteria bacterium]
MESLSIFLHNLTQQTLPLWIFVLLSIVLILFLITLPFAGFATYLERKVSADIQARIGPNRVGPYGLLQFIADGIKLILKEDIIPTASDKIFFRMAPMIVIIGSFSMFVIIPFAQKIVIADLNIGVLYILAMGSFVALGTIMGGWASNNKWSLLGGMRSAASVISYEIPAALALLNVILVSGSMSFGHIVDQQKFFNWNLFHNPFLFISFFIYFISALAEVNRTPFDIPEADSELVGGYHTEYSGMRFALFFLAEYADIFVICAVATAAFLGGWHVPFLNYENIAEGVQLPLQFIITLTKILVLFYVVMWLRWTLPRYRVDQLLGLCWKFLTPLSFLMVILTSMWMLCFGGRSFYGIIIGFFS